MIPKIWASALKVVDQHCIIGAGVHLHSFQSTKLLNPSALKSEYQPRGTSLSWRFEPGDNNGLVWQPYDGDHVELTYQSWKTFSCTVDDWKNIRSWLLKQFVNLQKLKHVSFNCSSFGNQPADKENILPIIQRLSVAVLISHKLITTSETNRKM